MNISQIEKLFSNKLPKSYIEFMLSTDGGSLDNIYIYSLKDLVERNECYETKEYAPGYFTIGDDGGGIAIMIEFNKDDSPVYSVEHASMDFDDFELVSKSFKAWVSTDSLSIPSEVKSFFSINLTGKCQFDLGFERFEFPEINNLNDFQTGYRTHGLTEKLIDAWSSNWIVIASSNADPLIYNSDTGSVMFARHGSGTWEPITLFCNLEEMHRCFSLVADIVTQADEELYDDDFNIKELYVSSIKESIKNFLGEEKGDLLIDTFEIKVYE